VTVGRPPRDSLPGSAGRDWLPGNPERRPSDADKRRALRLALLREEIQADLGPGVTGEEIQAAAERLLNLAA
jgi:hypothetical protein